MSLEPRDERACPCPLIIAAISIAELRRDRQRVAEFLRQGYKHLLAQSVEWARKEKLHSGRSRKPGPDLISSASADHADAGLKGFATASLPPTFSAADHLDHTAEPCGGN